MTAARRCRNLAGLNRKITRGAAKRGAPLKIGCWDAAGAAAR